MPTSGTKEQELDPWPTVADRSARAVMSIIGDTPYDDLERVQLSATIESLGAVTESTFLVHLGDIKGQRQGDCREIDYTAVADQLRASTVPIFMLPGDNEWNDCDDPDQAWRWWETTFDSFDAGWKFGSAVSRQSGRNENFAFVHEGVLFVGINLVGGRVHDEAEWSQRPIDDADWLDENIAHDPGVDAVVVFGHAGPDDDREVFFDRLVAAAVAFGKPVLFVHGDGHEWIDDQPWDPPNLYRNQVEGRAAPPLLLGYDPAYDPPFIYDHSPH